MESLSLEPIRLRRRYKSISYCAILAGLSATTVGCQIENRSAPSASAGVALTGHVHGGQQPVSGSRVYLYAASTSGYATAAVSLLQGIGYVTTDEGGNFSITGDYVCPAGAYVYLVALGGNPGLAPGTDNTKLSLMASLGACANLLPTTFVSINEVTTVAAAFALAPFAASETALGTSGTNVQGLSNAFGTISNLVSTTSGAVLAMTPAGNGTVPQAEINSLANALAACVNSDGTGTVCSTLMAAANVSSGNGTPVDTVQAAINIAQNPAANVATIFALATPNSPFQPTLGSAPNDWTMSIQYRGGGIAQAEGVAVDANGNVWTSNHDSNSVTELSPAGVFLSGAAGYTSASISFPTGIAIDLAGNAWVPSNKLPGGGQNSLQEFSANGSVLSGASGFTSACLFGPFGVTIDSSSNVWVGGSQLCEFNSAGVLVSPTVGYTGGGLQALTHQILIDTSGTIWPSGYTFTSSVNWTLSKFSSAGTALSPLSGYTSDAFNEANASAIDRSGNIWVCGFHVDLVTGSITGGGISEFDNTGTMLSPSSGYPANFAQWMLVDGVDHIWSSYASTAMSGSALVELSNNGTSISPAGGYFIPNGGFSAAIDASGNLWQGNVTTLTETIGLAAPVVTPLTKAVSTNMLGQRP